MDAADGRAGLDDEHMGSSEQSKPPMNHITTRMAPLT
jgi:hypothetical protein